MLKKKVLYLEDLYNFYFAQNKNVTFSSTDSDTSIVVHIDEPYTFSKYKDDELNLYTTLHLCHTLENRNKSYISEKSMKDAISSAYNMPILGYIWHDEENDEDVFASHEFYEKDGETIYEEFPIGVITNDTKLTLSEANSEGKKYLMGTGIIWKTYTKAAEILEREKELSVSVELVVDELSYSADTHQLNIDKFRFSGVTILQKSRVDGSDVEPGMAGANITIADFSEDNNATFSAELLEQIKQLNKNFETINSAKKEGGKDMKKKAMSEQVVSEELTEDVVVTPSDDIVTVMEEIEATEETESENTEINENEENDNDAEENAVEDTDDNNVEDVSEDTEESSDENEEGSDSSDKSDDEVKTEEYSLTLPDGTVKTFSLSLDDIQMALSTLVNDSYGELDNDWYSVSVYPDESKVVMYSWWTGNAYRQSYKRKKDTFTLEGERVPVHSIWVSDDEEKVLNDAKANFEAVSEKLSDAENKLAKYEAEPEKIELLQSESYAKIVETDEYKELSKRETYFDLDKEELEKKLDEVILKYAKSGKLDFSAKESDEKQNKKNYSKKPLPTFKSESVKGRYGSLFKKD